MVSVSRLKPSPSNADTVDFRVTFNDDVTGVDVSDFELLQTGQVADATVDSVMGAGAEWDVTVGTGTGDGTLRLDVVDDDSIVGDGDLALGGFGLGNGSFDSGEAYTIDKTLPIITVLGENPASVGCSHVLYGRRGYGPGRHGRRADGFHCYGERCRYRYHRHVLGYL